MSTICKIATPASEQDVLSALRRFLGEKGRRFTESITEWPLASDHARFRPDAEFPSVFSVKQVTNAVSEVHFNSLSAVQELVSFLSRTLATSVVVNEYQSVSTASYWALYSGGVLRRAIEAADAVVLSQHGDPLPFEGPEPGHDIGEDGGTFVVFDDEDQSRYNHEVQVPVEVYQQYNANWRNIELQNAPWWQFWVRRATQHDR
jgi:hypothetical protein